MLTFIYTSNAWKTLKLWIISYFFLEMSSTPPPLSPNTHTPLMLHHTIMSLMSLLCIIYLLYGFLKIWKLDPLQTLFFLHFCLWKYHFSSIIIFSPNIRWKGAVYKLIFYSCQWERSFPNFENIFIENHSNIPYKFHMHHIKKNYSQGQ